MKDYFVLASKNLKKRGVRSWLTLLGVFIGIAAVVSLISLGNTLKDTVNSQFDIGSTDIITIQAGGISGLGPPGTAVSNPLISDDAEAIERIGSIDWAIGRHIESVAVEFDDKLSFETVGSLPDNRRIDDIYNQLELEAEIGRLLQAGENNKIMIGKNLADGSRNGFEKDIRINDKLLINEKEFRVVGILEGEGSFTIDGIIFMSQGEIEEINDIEDDVDLIVAKVRDPSLVDNAKEEIEKLLRQRRDVKIGEEDFEVSTPQAALETVNQVLLGVQIFIVIIASISIIVGAIGIANTMLTSVLERRKEIGTMKAIGARNEDIFYQFFTEAGLLGLIGGTIGILLGVGFSYLGTYGLNNFLNTTTMPNIGLGLIVFSLLGSFLIGAISGIVPAMRAAKENPVEAIRG